MIRIVYPDELIHSSYVAVDPSNSLWHYGRPGMKWYQHIYGDHLERSLKMADKREGNAARKERSARKYLGTRRYKRANNKFIRAVKRTDKVLSKQAALDRKVDKQNISARNRIAQERSSIAINDYAKRSGQGDNSKGTLDKAISRSNKVISMTQRKYNTDWNWGEKSPGSVSKSGTVLYNSTGYTPTKKSTIDGVYGKGSYSKVYGKSSKHKKRR